MAKLSQDDLLAQFEEMTLIELSEFVKAFEAKFDVILEGAGDKKIQVIKVVRELTSLGLKEAKDLVDGTPKPVLEKVAKEAAEKAAESLKAAGASVTVK
jgi:large subunit ribosomal protein L7/L12